MITININKAKVMAHDKRRDARAKEFAPLDDIIMKQIPGNDYVATEALRQAVRDKYAAMQIEIDSANNVSSLKASIASVL